MCVIYIYIIGEYGRKGYCHFISFRRMFTTVINRFSCDHVTQKQTKNVRNSQCDENVMVCLTLFTESQDFNLSNLTSFNKSR